MSAEGAVLTTMDDTCSLRGFGTLPNRPLPHLVLTDSKETAEIQHLSHGGDQFR